jgi:hypothetical protein
MHCRHALWSILSPKVYQKLPRSSTIASGSQVSPVSAGSCQPVTMSRVILQPRNVGTETAPG